METRRVKVKAPSIEDMIINEKVDRQPVRQQNINDIYLEQLNKYM
jgi:hypothetical protein